MGTGSIIGAVTLGAVVGVLLIVVFDQVVRWYQRRNALPFQSRLLIASGVISQKSESKGQDSTYVAYIASAFDDSNAPEELKKNSDQVRLIGGPFDGCLGIFPPGFSVCRGWLLPVHRNLKRYAVYRLFGTDDNWEGATLTKHHEYRFVRFLKAGGPADAIQEMSRINQESTQ